MIKNTILKSLLLGAVMLIPSWATSFTPSSGTIQATVIIDVSLNILDADFRTPGGGVILTDTVNSLLLTDFFASPAFGNVVLRGFDSPALASSFDLTFAKATGNFVGGTFFITGSGSLLTGSSNPSIDPFLGPVQFQFAVNSTSAIDDTEFFAVTAYLQSVEASNAVPEPATMALCALALISGTAYKRHASRK